MLVNLYCHHYLCPVLLFDWQGDVRLLQEMGMDAYIGSRSLGPEYCQVSIYKSYLNMFRAMSTLATVKTMSTSCTPSELYY